MAFGLQNALKKKKHPKKFIFPRVSVRFWVWKLLMIEIETKKEQKMSCLCFFSLHAYLAVSEPTTGVNFCTEAGFTEKNGCDCPTDLISN